MKMKKRLFALLAALLCMVMLMGCTAPMRGRSPTS